MLKPAGDNQAAESMKNEGPMTPIQRIAVLAFSVFSTLAIAQTPTPQQDQQPNNPPVPSQTTTTTTTVQDNSAPRAVRDSAMPVYTDPAPMTKREMRAQRKRQKQLEKSADADAKARKYDAKALKQDNKSTDAAEKANNPD
jgi:hypothetical protein